VTLCGACMQLVVTYTNADDRALGLKVLEREAVPFEVRQIDDEGLEISEVYVADDQFDRACDVIEGLEAWIAKEQQQARKMTCPSCGAELRRCDDVDFSGSVTGITSVLKCQGCGRLIPR
jgi:hypothetical protein